MLVFAVESCLKFVFYSSFLDLHGQKYSVSENTDLYYAISKHLLTHYTKQPSYSPTENVQLDFYFEMKITPESMQEKGGTTVFYSLPFLIVCIFVMQWEI